MKILCFDYGERYIGAATGDTDIGIATPKTVIENSSKDVLRGEIAELISASAAERAVVGIPISFKMEETAFSAKARTFGRWLGREFKIPVDFENEVLSSAHAERLRQGAPKDALHAVAASLILQSWLDRRKS